MRSAAAAFTGWLIKENSPDYLESLARAKWLHNEGLKSLSS